MEDTRVMSWEWERPLMAVSGLRFCRRGSILTFLLMGLILCLSGDGVNTWLMQDVEDDGGVSLRVNLFLGDVLVVLCGSRSLDPPFCDMAASLARCICCLKGVLLISGEKVNGTCLLPRAWITISSGDSVCPNESSKLLPESRLLSGIWRGELSRMCGLSAVMVLVGVAVAGLRTVSWWKLLEIVAVVWLSCCWLMRSSSRVIPSGKPLCCISWSTLVVLLVVGERGLFIRRNNAWWSSILDFCFPCFLFDEWMLSRRMKCRN